jgi:ABC-type glycerol-3-phosphate transport system substrate-binding protein
VMDPRTTVTQELLTYLDAELSNALNGMKTPEQALNDAAKLMQEALDRG